MEEYSREGHRDRLRQDYLKNGYDNMSDAKLLELLLSLIIPRRDVKQVMYNLLNKFGSVANVFDASADELLEVDGISENTAFSLEIISKIALRMDDDDAIKNIPLTKAADRKKFARLLFENEKKEKTAFVAVDNSDRAAGIFVFDGLYFQKESERLELVEKMFFTASSQCMFVHYTPNLQKNFSIRELNLVLDLRECLKPLHLHFLDFITMNNECIMSISSSKKYFGYIK